MTKRCNKVISIVLTIILFISTTPKHTLANTDIVLKTIDYSMFGTDVIEKMKFIDSDGIQVQMTRIIHTDGTAELITIKDDEETIDYLNNHDYNLFYELANDSYELGQNSNLHGIMTRGSDIIGSQYKHIFISSRNYTITNDAIGQILVGTASTAAGILISALGLPGGVALSLGSLVFTVVSALSPYKMVISQSLYEVLFSYDNVYYTHCYHEYIKSYDTGNHLIDTRTDYYQAVGG